MHGHHSLPEARAPLVGGTSARAALRRCTVGLVLVAALATGCSDDDSSSNGSGTTDATVGTTVDATSDATSDPQTSTATESTQPDTTGTPAGDLDAFDAITVATQTTPGTVIDIGQDTEHGQAVWEVVVRRDDGSGIEHTIAIATGEVLEQETASVPSVAATLPAVSIEDAITTALATVPGSQLIEADLDTEGSAVVWEVLVRPSSGPNIELYIDATTGEVIKQEVDD